MSMVGFPLLLIPVAIYNIIVFLMPGVSFADPVAKLTLMSGAEWPLTLSDILLALAILLLLVEVIKGARPGAKYLTDHLLSLIVFGGAAAEFLLLPRFGSSTYFLLTLLAMVDFLSGIALRTRRRVAVAPAAAVSRKSGRKAETPTAEPAFEPVPVADAGSVATGTGRCVSRRIRAAGSPWTGSCGKRRIAGSVRRRGCSPVMARRFRQTRRRGPDVERFRADIGLRKCVKTRREPGSDLTRTEQAQTVCRGRMPAPSTRCWFAL